MRECWCLENFDTDLFLYITDKARSGTGLERDLIQNVAEFEFHVRSLGVFSRRAQYVPIDRLACPRLVSGCGGSDASLYVPLEATAFWYALSIRRLARNVAVDLMLALVVIGRLTELK